MSENLSLQGTSVSESTSGRDLLRNIAQALVVLSGLNWGWKALSGKDLVSMLIKDHTVRRVLFGIVGAAALYLVADWLLPKPPKYLGQCMMPNRAVKQRTPTQADLNLPVKVTPGAKVVYWAGERDEMIEEDMAGLLHNVGVTTADKDGSAVLKIRTPIQYRMGGATTPFYVHWRYANPQSSIWSEVYTLTLGEKLE